MDLSLEIMYIEDEIGYRLTHVYIIEKLFQHIIFLLSIWYYFFNVSPTDSEETGDIDEVHFNIPGSKNCITLS